MTDRHLKERATTLILVPTMMLVFIVLGGIAIDMSIIHLAHRRTHAVLSAAADDAAGMIDERRLQTEGIIVLDPIAARRVATARLSVDRLPGQVSASPVITADPLTSTVTITLSVRVDHVFLKSVPGFTPEELTVAASARLNK